MYSDLFMVLPTDGYVNNRRSNYPYGKVGQTSWVSQNGSKLGTSIVQGYTGTVFEPIDSFKGDFARIYFYVATRYKDEIPSWSSNFLAIIYRSGQKIYFFNGII
jgi:endonuclease I